MEKDSDDLLPCIKFLEQVLKNENGNSSAAAS